MAKKKTKPVEPLFGRLCLITPNAFDPDKFAPVLEEALAAGDVASLLLALDSVEPADKARTARMLTEIAQSQGVAAIVVNDPQLLASAGADGLHVDTGLVALRQAVDALHPDRIVGAASLATRHDAMLAAETECDYLFFGRLDGDTEDAIFDKSFDMAAWWSAVFEIPAIVMGGRAIASVIEAVDARIEFVALRSAIWEHPDGAAAAVIEANRLIAARQTEAAS